MSVKYGKFIPPKIEFKGDITKMKVVTKVKLGYAFASRPIIFKGYLVFHFDKSLAFYNQNTFNLISKFAFAEEDDEDEIFSFKEIDEDTLLITNNTSARFVRFSESEPKK